MLFSLIIMITSFKRIWHLRELVFIKGRSTGSLVRCSPLFAPWDPLTHTDPCRRRKRNCLKLQAMKKSNRNTHSRDLKLNPAANVPRQPCSTRPLSNTFYFFSVLQLQSYKVKVYYYRHCKARDLRVFLDSHIFINWLSYSSLADWL